MNYSHLITNKDTCNFILKYVDTKSKHWKILSKRYKTSKICNCNMFNKNILLAYILVL